MKLTDSDELIVLALWLHPSQAIVERMNECVAHISDWTLYANRLADTGVGQLLYTKTHLLSNAARIPQPALDKLKQSYMLTLSRSMRFYAAAVQIATTCASHGIPCMPLKGIALLDTLYPDYGLRLLSDIDLLVSTDYAQQAHECIRSLGYTAPGSDDFVSRHRELVHFDPLVKAGVAVELHLKLHRSIETYHIDPSEFLQKGTPDSIHKFLRPHPLEHLMFIAIHLDRHFTQGAIQLSGYCDLLNLCAALTPGEWDELNTLAIRANCQRELFKHVVLLSRYAHLQVPEHLIALYAGTITADHRQRFVAYLRGERFFQSGIPSHLSSLKSLSFTAKLRYIWLTVFPPFQFMCEKYGFAPVTSSPTTPQSRKTSRFNLFIWYPQRWISGLKGIIGFMKK